MPDLADHQRWAEEGLFLGDCRDRLRELDENSIDAGAIDPPYGIGFMGKAWDRFEPGQEAKRVVANRDRDREGDNPNVAGRQRSPAASPSAVEYDRTLAGQRLFQDWTASWAAELLRVLKPGAHAVVFGAPRSHHRMMAGLEDAGFEVRDTLMWLFGQGFPKSKNLGDGWGTALKPAWEPIALVRKPLGRLTTEAAFREFGTGGLAIDQCRVEGSRWPADLLLDAQAGEILDAQAGDRTSGARSTSVIRKSEMTRGIYGRYGGDGTQAYPYDVPASSGGPSRFFYCPKVSRAEREFGCDHLPARSAGEVTGGREEGSAGLNNPRAGAGRSTTSHNAHPTVKPINLMRWLIRLITPPGGIVVDPFVGSGSTAIAAMLEGRGFYGTDLEEEWLNVAHARVVAWRAKAAAGEVDDPAAKEQDVPLPMEGPTA